MLRYVLFVCSATFVDFITKLILNISNTFFFVVIVESYYCIRKDLDFSLVQYYKSVWYIRKPGVRLIPMIELHRM